VPDPNFAIHRFLPGGLAANGATIFPRIVDQCAGRSNGRNVKVVEYVFGHVELIDFGDFRLLVTQAIAIVLDLVKVFGKVRREIGLFLVLKSSQPFRTFPSSTDASEVDVAACVFCCADAIPNMSKTATATATAMRVVFIGGSWSKGASDTTP